MTRARSHFLTFLGLLLVAFLLIALDQGERMSAPQDIGLRLTLPAEVGFASLGRTIDDFLGTVGRMDELQAENDTLRRQIDDLTLVNVRVIALEAENAQLREQLEYKEEHPNYTLQVAEIVAQESPAYVVGREVSNLAQAVRINQGRETGIEPGMSVVTARGLVGRVRESGQGWANVLLLTDERSSVTAVVQQDRASGVVEGTGDGLVMRYIPHEQRVEPGDVVLSAGLGGLFPKGLVIGVVESIVRGDVNPWQE
ncbi:MAG: rod shape-determining protein MreC, partial [Ardenticatenaceae bacterium]